MQDAHSIGIISHASSGPPTFDVQISDLDLVIVLETILRLMISHHDAQNRLYLLPYPILHAIP
jgi:hypothetical protein